VNELLLRAGLLLAVIGLATGLGLVLRSRSGQARTVTDGERLSPAELGAELGARATFVQFSSPACSPCRSVRRVLGELVTAEPALAHVDIDATERLDLARRLGILRTPTVVLLDPHGQVIRRISGPITPQQARAAVPEEIGSR
jgi:thiol-disulfide isomerase/thioredoxin